MTRLFHEVPWSVRTAATMIAAQGVIGAANTVVFYQTSIPFKVWFFALLGEAIFVVIAFALLRRGAIARLLWAIWCVGTFLLLLGKLSVLLSSATSLLLYTLFASAWKLTSAGLLFLPAARSFFEKRTSPPQHIALDHTLEVSGNKSCPSKQSST